MDRLANAVAARRRFGVPAVVVDFGTAVTFDVIDQVGNYVGGYQTGCYVTYVGDFNDDGLPDLLRYSSPGFDSQGNAQACTGGEPSMLFTSNGDGSLSLEVMDHVLGRPIRIVPDVVVLATAVPAASTFLVTR